MSEQSFSSVAHEAFEFLVSEYSYAPEPVHRGPYGASVSNYEGEHLRVSIEVGNPDSEPWCQVFFVPPWLDKKMFSRWGEGFSLRRILDIRCPGFEFKSNEEMSDRRIQSHHLTEIADMLREHAGDLLEGDFSAFKPYVFALLSRETDAKGNLFTKLHGIFSDIDKAEAAVTKKSGLCSHSGPNDDLVIWAIQLDLSVDGAGGIPLARNDT